MSDFLAVLSVPGLRDGDLERMPRLRKLMSGGGQARYRPSFPAVTWPAQANLLTGKLPHEHGVVANGFYWREEDRVEMWTAWNDKIQSPQVWDLLKSAKPELTSAVWFPMLSKGCNADYVCMPAPIHNPDGSESLWCYTQPTADYGWFRDELGHFPLQHFWGPLAGIQSTQWIVNSAVMAAHKYRPNLFYLYLPQLDYAAQREGPDSPAAMAAAAQLDEALGNLMDGFAVAYPEPVTWMAVSEYTIGAVDHVAYPNRILREAGLLHVVDAEDGEQLDTAASRAWALVDHQFSHVFVKDANPNTLSAAASAFQGVAGIAEILVGDQRQAYAMNHARSGEIILISSPNSWQAYYWWNDDQRAPSFARTVDIHRKPGYDPVELCFDPASKSIPLDASLIRGSHGAPLPESENHAVFLCSRADLLPTGTIRDIDVLDLMLGCFGLTER